MLYYINYFLLFSFLGFNLESEVFKLNNSNIHSGIFYGPITEVYGFGVIHLLLVKKYFLDKLKCNKYLKVIFTFITSFVVLTLTEYIGGNVLNWLFDIDMWNYTKKAFNCGKYICLELSIAWALLGTFYLCFAKGFFDKIVSIIPKKLTLFLVIVNIIDTIITLLTK